MQFNKTTNPEQEKYKEKKQTDTKKGIKYLMERETKKTTSPVLCHLMLPKGIQGWGPSRPPLEVNSKTLPTGIAEAVNQAEIQVFLLLMLVCYHSTICAKKEDLGLA